MSVTNEKEITMADMPSEDELRRLLVGRSIVNAETRGLDRALRDRGVEG